MIQWELLVGKFGGVTHGKLQLVEPALPSYHNLATTSDLLAMRYLEVSAGELFKNSAAVVCIPTAHLFTSSTLSCVVHHRQENDHTSGRASLS